MKTLREKIRNEERGFDEDCGCCTTSVIEIDVLFNILKEFRIDIDKEEDVK